MRLVMAAVFDRKSQAFSVPICAPHAGVSVRQFEDMVNDKNSTYYRHSADYVLYQVGFYDDATGVSEPVIPPQSLAEADALKAEG